jgi:hypothetical protein
MNCSLRMYDSIERIFREPLVWRSVEFFVMLERNLVVILAEYGWQIIFLIHPDVIHVLDPLPHLSLMLLNHYLNNHRFHYKRKVFDGWESQRSLTQISIWNHRVRECALVYWVNALKVVDVFGNQAIEYKYDEENV